MQHIIVISGFAEGGRQVNNRTKVQCHSKMQMHCNAFLYSMEDSPIKIHLLTLDCKISFKLEVITRREPSAHRTDLEFASRSLVQTRSSPLEITEAFLVPAAMSQHPHRENCFPSVHLEFLVA